MWKSTDGGTTCNPVNEAGLDNSPVNPVNTLIRPRALFVEADNAVFYAMFEKPDLSGNPADDNAGFFREQDLGEGSRSEEMVTEPALVESHVVGQALVLGHLLL